MRSHLFRSRLFPLLRHHYARIALEAIKELMWNVFTFLMIAATFFIFIVPCMAYIVKHL